MRNTEIITAKHVVLRDYMKQSLIMMPDDDQNPWVLLLKDSANCHSMLSRLLNDTIFHPTAHELLMSVDDASSTNGLYWLMYAINDLLESVKTIYFPLIEKLNRIFNRNN